MRTYSTATSAAFATRSATVAHVLIWLQARNRQSGAIETIGFWTGDDHQEFTIDGVSRIYYGAGAAMTPDPLRRQTGLKVRNWRCKFSGVSAEAQMAVRGYDPRHAPVEVHRAMFDPLSRNLLDAPHLKLRGFIDAIQYQTPAKGDTGGITVDVANSARALTKGLSRYRSHATLQARDDTDDFRKYASVADAGETPWGR